MFWTLEYFSNLGYLFTIRSMPIYRLDEPLGPPLRLPTSMNVKEHLGIHQFSQRVTKLFEFHMHKYALDRVLRTTITPSILLRFE